MALDLPLYLETVPAGFPSPAQDYLDGVIDLNRELVLHPEATFCVTVRGDSMRDANLLDGDILVVDRSIKASSGSIAVCLLDGEFTVKRLVFSGEVITLVPENPSFKPLLVQPEQDFTVWGVGVWILHRAEAR